jgi:outer membrane protein TolC
VEKNILILLLTVFILFFSLTVFAEEIELNLTEALQLAEENNNSLLNAELTLRKSELNYKKAKSQNKLNQHLSKEILAEQNYLSAEKIYEDKRAEIIKDIINKYLTIISNKKEIQSQELTLMAEKRLYNEFEKRFELSEVNRVELLEQRNTFRDAEMRLQTLKDDLEQHLNDFKNMLKLDSLKFELSEVPEIDFWEISQPEALKIGFDNSKEIKIKKLDIRLAEINNEVEEIEAAEIDKKIASISIKEAEIALEDTKDSLENRIISSQLNLVQLENKIELEEQRLENHKREYNRVKREYELGSANLTALLQYEASYYNQQFNYHNTLLNYYLAVEELADILNLKPGVIFSE